MVLSEVLGASEIGEHIWPPSESVHLHSLQSYTSKMCAPICLFHPGQSQDFDAAAE